MSFLNSPSLDSTFAEAFRDELVAEVALGRAPRRRRLWFGALFAGVLLATGATGVATATLTAPPGSPVHEQLAPGVTVSLASPGGSLDLGVPPAGANSITFTVVCHAPGSWSLEGYGSAPCDPAELGQERRGSVPLTLSQQRTVPFELQAGTEVTVTAAYSKEVISDLGVNANGESYGSGVYYGDPDAVFEAGENPGPDLIAARATNCKPGYIRWSEQEEASGGTFTSFEEVDAWMAEGVYEDHYIPVYESDGVTVIGEFLIAGQPRPGEGLDSLTQLPPC